MVENYFVNVLRLHVQNLHELIAILSRLLVKQIHMKILCLKAQSRRTKFKDTLFLVISTIFSTF